MSKKALKSYLSAIPQEELIEQLTFLYTHFAEVKAYYGFALDSKEAYWMDKVKAQIYEEYYPAKRKRAKLRRSVIAKLQKQMEVWGMDPMKCMELRIYHLQIALLYHEDYRKINEAFTKAVHRLFSELIQYVLKHYLYAEARKDVEKLIEQAIAQRFPMAHLFRTELEKQLLENEKIK